MYCYEGEIGMKSILVVDDVATNLRMMEAVLKDSYKLTLVKSGEQALKFLSKNDVDLILMDLMLPFKSGERLIKELREYSKTPVIVLSAKTMMETKLEVLRLGADDYILKPFDLEEVLVRMEVVLRRSGAGDEEPKEADVLSCGELKYSLAENRVTFEGQEIALTAKEMHLLRLFLENPEKVFTKANLYEAVWNDVYYYEDNTINVHISNLRSKLKKATGREFVETVWGIGYRLKEN